MQIYFTLLQERLICFIILVNTSMKRCAFSFYIKISKYGDFLLRAIYSTVWELYKQNARCSSIIFVLCDGVCTL